MAPKTNVYVDGFNLYYAIRKTPYRWLDLGAVFRQLLPQNDIQHIHYCTARIKARPNDPLGPDRQDVYLRALATVPGLTIHYGTFLASKVFMRLVNPPAPPADPTVEVRKMEEKGSDVNLASLMLADAYENKCDVGVLVTNDSDLAFPLNVVSQRLGRPVGLVNPYDTNPNKTLMKQNPTFVRRLRHGLLGASQFPDPLIFNGQTLDKPQGW